MKRAGQLREAVLEPENLRLAFWKASRGKRGSAAQRAYAENLEEELEALREGLAEGTYPVGRYERFTIYEPKERLICAAAFRERVLHHALMNVCEPWFERWLAPNTYACRKGKGQTAAVAAASGWARRREWFLKWDVRKYFESIPHEGVLEMLGRRFKDAWAAGWFARILGTWVAGTDGEGRKRGLPIGNLTSQHLANLYLDPLDRLLQRRHGGEGMGYARYMDDFVFWADGREALRKVREEAREVLAGLGLEPKGAAEPRRTAWGMDFLGMRVHRDGVRLSRGARRRFAGRSRGVVRALNRGGGGGAGGAGAVDGAGGLHGGCAVPEVAAGGVQSIGRERNASGFPGFNRGGNWNNNANNCQCGNVNWNSPATANNNNGFRAVRRRAPLRRRDVARRSSPRFLPVPREGTNPKRPPPGASRRRSDERSRRRRFRGRTARAPAGKTRGVTR